MTRARAAHRTWLLGLGLLIAPTCLWAQNPPLLEVAKFSAGQAGPSLPEGWKPLTFKKVPKQTAYEMVKDGDR